MELICWLRFYGKGFISTSSDDEGSGLANVFISLKHPWYGRNPVNVVIKKIAQQQNQLK